MKHKVGDKVRIKSLEWYNENKDRLGHIQNCGNDTFTNFMSIYCGMYAIIRDVDDDGEYSINIDDNEWSWTDEMFEKIN